MELEKESVFKLVLFNEEFYLNLVIFSFPFLSSERGHSDTVVFFYLWIVFCIISSCYTLIWDLKMDWGLFDKNAGENTFLREEIVYPQKVCTKSPWVYLKKKNKTTTQVYLLQYIPNPNLI